MRFNTLDAWLQWQATLNPTEIELGLERIATVLNKLDLTSHFDCPLITVAGTNGKGSVVAMLQSIALAAGYKVASYTSPHIQRYNERIAIDGVLASDEDLCASFQRIDNARGDIQLTYFEFGTLAAIDLFHRADVDLVIMEIGLGGRLDAVNIMAPDVAVITTIDIDHTDWLGDTREAIGYEKAGIFRQGSPVICGDTAPPKSLLRVASDLNIKPLIYGVDFTATPNKALPEHTWDLSAISLNLKSLPLPVLQGDFQRQNAAVAIMALVQLAEKLSISAEAIAQGLETTYLAGRYQRIHQQPDVYVDVAHNIQAAKALLTQLSQGSDSYQKTHAVIAMLADKDVASVIEIVGSAVDYWYCAGLESVSRGMSAKSMASVFEQGHASVKLHAETTVEQACRTALNCAEPHDRIIVFGSFYTVSEAITFFEQLNIQSSDVN